MQIIKDYSNIEQNSNTKALGYSYKVIVNDKMYSYEFNVEDNIAYINYDNYEYLEAVINEFRKAYEYVNIYKSYDNDFYAEFEKVHTFKLPINIIQVSEMLLNEERINVLENIVEPENIHLSVRIINDEYVLLGDHHLLYSLKMIGERMVNVFINTTLEEKTVELLSQLIYVLKENNITDISKCEIMKKNDYFFQAEQYINLFNEM